MAKKNWLVVFPIDRPPKPGVTVTDFVMRGGGGTITFSDNVTYEWFWKFDQDPSIPAGGRMKITLDGPRASLVYQTIVDQTVCNFYDWLLQCTDLASRIAQLELSAGLAKEVRFFAADWAAGTPNEVHIIPVGAPGAGQRGPHELPVTGKAYAITVQEDSGATLTLGVDVGYRIDLSTGDVFLTKTGLAADFDGRVIITASA